MRSARNSTVIRLVWLAAFLANPAGSRPAAEPAMRASRFQPESPPAPGSGAQHQGATFNIYVRGIQIGTEEVSVRRSAEGWTIGGSGRLGAPLNLVARKLEVRYDAGWKPRDLVMDLTSGSQQFLLQTRFEGTSANSEITRDGKTIQDSDDVSADTLVLPNHFFGAYEALTLRLASAASAQELKAYVAPEGEIPVRISAAIEERLQTAKEIIDARRYQVTFENPGGPLDAEIWSVADGRLLRISLPTVAFDVVREDIASVATRRLTHSNPGDEDVRVPANGFSLAATLTRPPSAAASTTAGSPAAAGAAPRVPPDSKGRRPAAILVGGSGAIDRDGSVTGIPILGQIAGALADAGFMVIRYDKRGTGQSGGRAEAATLADYAEDVRSVVKYLKKRKDVDSKRIVIVGHSEGGWVSLLAGSKEKRVAALALLATPGTVGADLILEQQRQALEGMKLTEAEKQDRIETQKKIHAAVAGEGTWDDVPPELRRQADSPWFSSFLAFDPAAVMKKVRQPLLILQGELDQQVPPHHADRLGELARARKRRVPVEVVRIADVNHLLTTAPTGEISVPKLQEKRVSEGLLKTLTDWLTETLVKST